jgi:hypothetical protein
MTIEFERLGMPNNFEVVLEVLINFQFYSYLGEQYGAFLTAIEMNLAGMPYHARQITRKHLHLQAERLLPSNQVQKYPVSPG